MSEVGIDLEVRIPWLRDCEGVLGEPHIPRQCTRFTHMQLQVSVFACVSDTGHAYIEVGFGTVVQC